MNIVYPYKHFNPAELIYSLKSLKNYKDAGEVFIIGDSPRNDITGFTLLEHEPATWAGCSRYHDVTSKIYQYAKTHTGDFLLMNDDFFMLSDYTPTNYYRGKLLDGLREGNMTSYKREQVYMLNWLRRQGLPLLSYELHVPMVINCEKAVETIKQVLTEELGYSFYYKVIKASDYGVPQHRPRLFMVGFKDKSIKFEFPKPVKLQMTMADVFNAKEVNREVGFTLRVGGRGSGLNDRRNWDTYLVDGEVKRIGTKEGLRLQGFPDSFVFPVSETQAMKQLGNSVAVPAIQATADQIVKALEGVSAPALEPQIVDQSDVEGAFAPQGVIKTVMDSI